MMKKSFTIAIILWYLAVLFGSLDSKATDSAYYAYDSSSALEDLTAANLTTNILDWEADLAIMFYAPWSDSSRQLKPSWETIKYLTNKDKTLLVARFNCEQPQSNAEICSTLGVDRYPSIIFIGYGNFNQAPKNGFILGKNRMPRVVRYDVNIFYAEALYDWVLTMHFISKLHMWWDDFKGILTGKTRAHKKLERMQLRLEKAEKKARLFGKELEKYKANEVFDSIEFHGDPFPLLNQLEPDEVS